VANAETTPAASFGSGRGSGLARGRRSPSASAPSATPVKADYKPTAVQVITPTREYRNPFASPEPANAPASEPAQSEGSAPAEAKAEAQPEQAPKAEAQPEQAPAPASAERPEIQILPPAESNRQAVRWESPAAAGGQGSPAQERPERARRDERPAFRPERRPETYGGSPQGHGREQRHDSFRRQQPRDEYPRRDQVAPGPAANPAPKGFFGWLKGLFGGAKPAEAPVQERDQPAGQFGDGQRHRRRHRGGRRHGGGGGGPQGGEFENRGGEPGGDFEGGHRRRHRGGRGRDQGGEPRSEGHQGGGAI
jgi:translation initiation factor IF-2